MAEKFGIGSGPHELKIGNSFCSKNGNGKFHTIRYDFKPASVDKSKVGVVDVGESNSVSVSVPHSKSHGETNYSGHIKGSGQKECILIIDRETGEITLEKISGHMLLKKTRPERPEKGGSSPTASSSSSRPLTPVHSRQRESPASTPKAMSRSASPLVMPNYASSDAMMMTTAPSTTPAPTVKATAAPSTNNIDLSDSSSDSSSSGSDSDSDLEDVPALGSSNQSKSIATSNVVEHPSMPMFGDVTDFNSLPMTSSRTTTTTTSQAQSMPQLLNDDLQLSESEDEDSD